MLKTSGLDAVGRMAESGSRQALAVLREQFEKGSLEMRRSICRLLGKIKDPDAFDLLVGALKDGDPGIRVFAVQALAHREEAGTKGLLRRVGEGDPDKQVREAIRKALEVGK